MLIMISNILCYKDITNTDGSKKKLPLIFMNERKFLPAAIETTTIIS